ncbi:MAG: hypothetical protein ACRD2N_12210 [Vicinamibacterales bacterium]
MALVVWASAALAQEAGVEASTHDHSQSAPQTWTWDVDATAFFGYNYQYRKFRDFDEWESQNWLMGTGSRTLGRSRLQLSTMLSLEALTLTDLGSPQVFQTGETFKGAPLIDYQHPHDLVMHLGGSVATSIGATVVHTGAYLVGEAPLGPGAFMHRPSSSENPQSPLSHHYLDSTHITPGVVRAAIERSGFRLDAGVFRGREPDDNRTDFDLGALDSFAAQLSWARGPWSAQASNGWLTRPEIVTPYDATQTTASIAYFAGNENRSAAWLAAFGQKREFHGTFEGYLLEGTLRRARHIFYSRAEWVIKDILDAGYHPIGIKHTHRQSPIGALTVGYVRDLTTGRFGAFGVGGDVTGYVAADNLQDSYGSPWSFHLFVRYRARPSASPAHVH